METFDFDHLTARQILVSVRGHTVLSDSGNHLIRWYFAFSKSCLAFAISVQITFTGDVQQYENIEWSLLQVIIKA